MKLLKTQLKILIHSEEFKMVRMHILLLSLTFMIMVVGCTLSFQNISTHGVATDLVDEEQRATADVKADLKTSPL